MEEYRDYALFLREEKYRTHTRLSAYYKSTQVKEKTKGPIDINGRRMQIDFNTGELRYYDLEEVLANKYNSVERSKQMLEKLLNMNKFDWFCTLTFDNQKVNRDNEEEIYNIYQKFIDNIKHQFPTLRYVTVLERHEDGHIHFHMVIAGVPWQKLGLVNSGKVCCHWATKKNGVCSPEYFNKTKHLHELKDTDGQPIYNITSFIYGYTTASRIVNPDKCASYIKKYIDKALGSTEKFKKRFYYSSNLNVPEEVKYCIGAGFEKPKPLNYLMANEPLFVLAESRKYYKEENVLCATIENEKLQNLRKGLLPITEETPFDSEV